MPDNALSGLYPQPQQQQKPLDPFQAIGALGNILAFQKNQLELNANKAIGEEYRNALGPNGLDIAKLAGGLKSNPNAGYGLPEATSRMIAQQGGQISNRGGQIQNTTAQFQQLLGMNSVLTNGIASLANDPELNKEKVLHWATTTARTTGIPGSVIGPWVTSLSDNPGQLRDQVRTLLAAGLGPAGVAQRVEGPAGPGGTPSSIPAGAAIYGGGGPQGGAAGGAPGQVYTGQPVGEDIGQKGSAARGESLAANATTSSQIHADLDNLLTESKVMGPNVSGPTAEIEKRAAQLFNRLGLPPLTMTAEQLKAGEGYDKIASTIAAQQAARLGASTDAGRHMSEHMTPSMSMSPEGRDLITRRLHGNQDFIDTAAREWQKVYKGGAGGVPLSGHDKFMADFASQPGADPRVFQYHRMLPADRRAFLATIGTKGSPEAEEFIRKDKDAIARGWVK